MKQDDFGDRMKAYEKVSTSATLSHKDWMCVRIDGKGFSKFTKSFIKPFDDHLSETMIQTTEALVRETHASVGYTQSDEITLLYEPTETDRIFGGKLSKINSVFTSIATAHFNKLIKADKLAYFDCRAWSLPSEIEASNALLWRVQDARKNSISSMFRWTAGHKAMHGLDQLGMKDYMLTHCKIDWNELHDRYKYGTYVKRKNSVQQLTLDEYLKIPEKKRPLDGNVYRTQIVRAEVGYFGDLSLEERVDFTKTKGLL